MRFFQLIFYKEKANTLHSLNIQKLLQISADQPEAYKTYCLNKQFRERVPDLFLKSYIFYSKEREYVYGKTCRGRLLNLH